MTRRRAPFAAVTLAALLLGACGGDTATAPAGPVVIDPGQLAPDCARAVPQRQLPPVPGLIGPANTAVGSSAPRGPGRLVTGYVDLAPDDFVNQAAGRQDWTVVYRESEGVDSEIMISDGTNRVLWSLRIACPTGSTFTALVAKEDAEGRRFIVPPKGRL